MTTRTEHLNIKTKGWNNNFLKVRLVPNKGKNLLSVGQLTTDPKFTLKFKGNNFSITLENRLVAQAIKCNDNLYLIQEVFNKHFTAEINDTITDNKSYDDS